jgi:hypothetical protein
MLTLLLTVAAQAAPCDAPVSPASLAAQADEATLAWATLDEDGFVEALDALDAGLPCLEAPLGPDQAAAVHRMHGLRAFLEDDSDAARASFRAAALADPGYELSDRVAPEGGKLWRLITEAAAADGEAGRPLSLLDGGQVWVDGVVGGARAEDRPAVVQVGADRSVVWSRLLGPGEAFAPPAAALATLPSRPAAAVAPPKAPRAKKGLDPMWIAAGGAAAASAGLFGASAGLRGQFDAAPSRSLHSATNGTFVGSVGMAAVTGGLVTAALVRSRRR